MKAVLCPVCNGVGKVSNGFYNRAGNYPYWVSANVNPEVCRSCNGKGWIEISSTDGEKDIFYTSPEGFKLISH